MSEEKKDDNKIIPSEEQEKIITEPISDLLVSAAAGSGKTTVLVERIIREVIDGTLSLDQILVVTFTNDAAAHMGDKIESAIRTKIAECRLTGDTDLVRRLNDQLDLLPNAYIQTLDSFCSRVLKEKGYILSVPEELDVFASGNVILDENNLSLLRKHAAELAIEDMYLENLSEDSPFIDLTRRFGDGRTDSSLADCVVQVYRRLRNLPNYLDTIDKAVGEKAEKLDSGIVPSIEEFIEEISGTFRFFRRKMDELRDYCDSVGYYPIVKPRQLKKGDFVGKYPMDEAVDIVFDGFNGYLDMVLSVCDDPAADVRRKYDAIRDVSIISDMYDEKVFGLEKKNLEDSVFRSKLSVVKAIVNFCRMMGVKKSLSSAIPELFFLPKEYELIISKDYDTHLANAVSNNEVAKVFCEVLKKCDRYYAELKASVHGSDFADQEYGALQILSSDNPDAREYYREKFVEIYIDEYQDNSSLQDEIIKQIAREEGNVFRVGDVKQSIYKFRSSDPDIFIKRQDDKSKQTLYISQNHRSSFEVLSFVNFIFEQIMTKDGSEIEYDENQKLKEWEKTQHSSIPRVVVVNRNSEAWNDIDLSDLPSDEDEDVTDDNLKTDKGQDIEAAKDESEEQTEGTTEENKKEKVSTVDLNKRTSPALYYGVLNEVKEYLADPKHKPSDIYVLCKTVTRTKAIAEFLNMKGIRAVSEDRTKIFTDVNIQCVINLVILMGNEYRDEYLMAVMLKNLKFTNFTLNDIAKIMAYFKLNDSNFLYVNLMARIRRYVTVGDDEELKKRLADFLNVFDDLRMSSVNGDIDDLVNNIYKESGIAAVIREEDPFGSSKLALLKDWLSSNFKRYGTDISSIAMRLEEMKIKINTGAKFDKKAEADEAVRCLTIHKSKGLEKPKVILVYDDGRENSDSLGEIAFDKNKGFVINDCDTGLIVRGKSADRVMYDDLRGLEANAESLRLLYVALTRAEMDLSLVTTADFGANNLKYLNDALTAAMLNSDDTFGKAYWRYGTKKIGYAAMAALLRASCAAPLRAALGVSDSDFERIIDYEGFDVELVSDDELRELAAYEKTDDQKESVEKKAAEEKKKEELTDSYANEKSIKVPFKVAVTGIKSGEVNNATHVNLNVHSKEDFLNKLSGKITASGTGTIVHLIFQWADPEECRKDKGAFIGECNKLIDEGIFSKYQKDDVLKIAEKFYYGINVFWNSDIGKAMYDADLDGRAEFEKPVVFAVPAYEGAPEEEFALVQGIIDAIYYENDGAVIIDYKTDNYGKVTKEEVEREALKKHSFQIGCYAASCIASGIEVKAKYIYLVRYGQFVKVS